MRRPSVAIRIAALSFVSDAAFGTAMPFALAHLERTGALPMTPWGFRAYSGRFERLGPDRFTVLGWGFVAVCTLNVLAGVWLWQGRRRGAVLGLALTPVTLALGAGFELPFLLGPAPIRAGLVVVGRHSLS